MFNNKKQYLNILQQNKQLRINYKIVQDDKILKEEQSSFLTVDETIPKDAIFKINTLQKNIEKTYITTLSETANQKIIHINNVDKRSYDSISIGDNQSIVIPKEDINFIEKYFKATGIDFILSPFTIIEEYLIDNGKKNSLNFLIYNNFIYTLIYNTKKEISFSKTKLLTPFESTQDETFLEDEIVGQKLYEEVNFLEIQQFLNEVVEEYYKSSSNVEFLEHIEMLYTLKPMSDEQIILLQEELLIPISYRAISIDNYIDEIIESNNSPIYNFITPRIKKESKKIYLWIGLAILSVLLCIGVLTYTTNTQENVLNENNKQVVEKIIKEEVKTPKVISSVEPSTIVLPDHKNSNTQKLERIQMLLDVVPYDAILKDIEINQNNSTYVSNFVVNSDSLSDMQTKLKNIYVNSTLLLKTQNKVILNTIVKNDTLLDAYKINIPKTNIPYQKFKFLSSLEAEDYLSKIVIKDSIIKLIEQNKDNYLSYEFLIISKLQSPQELTSLIKKLNSQKISIEIDYPIVFSKTTNFIELKYTLIVHQQNKK
ncbi:hypothetical protein OAR97_04040 [Arcobacteraceae bacterium]|nr:hypothetical protein [Arcobacteraceae bacterium]